MTGRWQVVLQLYVSVVLRALSGPFVPSLCSFPGSPRAVLCRSLLFQVMGPDADLRLDAVGVLRGLEVGALGSGLLDGQRSWLTDGLCRLPSSLSLSLFVSHWKIRSLPSCDKGDLVTSSSCEKKEK